MPPCGLLLLDAGTPNKVVGRGCWGGLAELPAPNAAVPPDAAPKPKLAVGGLPKGLPCFCWPNMLTIADID